MWNGIWLMLYKLKKIKAMIIMKTPRINQQEKSDRIGAMIAFALFFGTLVYVIIEQFFN